MAQIDIIRPASTTSLSNMTVVGAANAHTALSDQDDASFVTPDPPLAQSWVGALATHSLPAGHGRHRARMAMRAKVTTSGQGTKVELNPPAQPRVSWNTDLPPLSEEPFYDIFGAWTNAPMVDAASWTPDVRLVRSGVGWHPGLPTHAVAEVWMEIDNREHPTFTPVVLDGDGAPADPIILTNRPVLATFGPFYDELNPRDWSAVLYTLAQTTAPGFVPFVTPGVWSQSAVGTFPFGNPYGSGYVMGPLVPDDYVVYLRISSTIAGSVDWPHTESLGFTVATPEVPAPTVVATVTDQTVEVCVDASAPGEDEQAFDGPWINTITRYDCAHPEGVVVAVSDPTEEEWCWTDCYAPLTIEGCADDEECPITYTVTQTGLVGEYSITTDPATTDELLVLSSGETRIIGVDCGVTVACQAGYGTWGRIRPSQAWQPATGGYPTVTVGAPGGRNHTLTLVVRRADLVAFEALMAQPAFFWSPISGPGTWLAPITETVTVETAAGTVTYQVDTVAVQMPL